MSTNTHKVISNLVQTLRDGQEGFENAAEGVKDAALKTRFLSFAAERQGMADELASFAALDADENSPTLAGTLHRGWINLKATLTSGDDHAVLSECERGEDHALEQLKEALDQPLPSEVQASVESIHVRVKAVHDEVKTLRDARA